MERLPPLNALRAFEAAGRLLSITQAAEELRVTPAAISHQIRLLEEHLRMKLFARSHRAIHLTPAGQQYLAEITRHLAGIRRATANMMQLRDRKVLRIRAYTTFGVRWLIPRLSSFHALHPDIDVRLTTSLEEVDFENEDIDAAIRLGAGNWSGLQADRLFPNELVPVCSPGMLERKPHVAQPEGLARETLLHSLARPDDWAHWLRAAGVTGVNPYGGMKYESSILAYQAAIEGQGIAIAQKALVEEDLSAGRLVMPCGFCLDMGAYTYYFIFPISNPRSVALEAFRDWLKAQKCEDG